MFGAGRERVSVSCDGGEGQVWSWAVGGSGRHGRSVLLGGSRKVVGSGLRKISRVGRGMVLRQEVRAELTGTRQGV